MIGLLGKIRNTRTGYCLGRWFLSHRLVNKNFIYKKAYRNCINKKMNSFEKSPPSLDIGITNFCNANCIMCPHSKLKKFGTMDFKLYKKIIDEAAEIGVKSISLTFFGEPLLDKGVFQKIKYTKEKGIDISFFSNGSLITKENARKLIESGLDSIHISFDGYSKETYEKIRRNLKFEEVKTNIINLINAKKELNKKNPKIILALVEQPANTNEVKKFHKEWKNKVDGINIINLRNWAGNIEPKKGFKSFHIRKGFDRVACMLIWRKMIIDWDGDVVLCCDAWNHQVVLGNLKKQSIKEIWFGEKLNKVRDLHKKGEFNKILLCKNCNKKTVWWLG